MVSKAVVEAKYTRVLTYATDPSAARNLALLEEHLANFLQSLLDNLPKERSECVFVLQKYLDKYHQDNNPIKHLQKSTRADAVMNNGLLTYKMILRLVNFQDGDDALTQCKVGKENIYNVWKHVKEGFSRANLTMPTHELDLQEALIGILRMQYIYGFNATSELRLGIFNGTDTKVSLDFEECVELGIEATQRGIHFLAYQWLEAAVKTVKTSSDKSTLDKAWRQLMFKTNTTDFTALQKQLAGQPQLTFSGMTEYRTYAGCRGEIDPTAPYVPKKRGRHCYYLHNNQGYLMLGPLKVEMHMEDPKIFQIYDFADNLTIKFLKSITNNKTKAMAGEAAEDGSPSRGEFRTGVDSELLQEIFDEPKLPRTLEKLVMKTELALGLTVFPSDMRINIYSPLNGYYDVHHDTLKDTPHYESELGERITRSLIYLNDVEMGGYTVYPLLGVHVKPVKGSMLVWPNVNRNGDVDMRTFHARCPVVLGIKQIATSSQYQHENTFKYPCFLNSSV